MHDPAATQPLQRRPRLHPVVGRSMAVSFETLTHLSIRLDLFDRVLAAAAMVNFLQRVLDSGAHRYDTRSMVHTMHEINFIIYFIHVMCCILYNFCMLAFNLRSLFSRRGHRNAYRAALHRHARMAPKSAAARTDRPESQCL